MPPVVEATPREVPLQLQMREPRVSLASKIASLGLGGALEELREAGPSCTAVNLADNAIGDAGVEVVIEVLARSEHTLRLSLARCGFGPAGFSALARLADENRVLESLVLSGNDVGDAGVPAELCEAVALNPTLQALHLSNCKLTRDRIQTICRSLSCERPELRRLNLSYNALDATAAADISDMLRKNRTLEDLELSSNNLQAKGGELLASALAARRCSVKRLCVDRNDLQLRGCQALLRLWASPDGSGLAHLDLRENHVAYEGCKQLMDIINAHRSDVSNRRALLSWPEKQGSIAPGRTGDPVNIFWEDAGVETRRGMPQELFTACRSEIVGESASGGREVGSKYSSRSPISPARSK